MSNETETNESEPTPLPWEKSFSGWERSDGTPCFYITPQFGKRDGVLDEEDADLILHRVHAHDALLAACELGAAMRDKQRAYFKNRTQENLIASKQAEAAFDKAVRLALQKSDA